MILHFCENDLGLILIRSVPYQIRNRVRMPQRGNVSLNVRIDSCRTDVEDFLPAFPSHIQYFVAVSHTYTHYTCMFGDADCVRPTLLLSYNFDASLIFFSAQLIECISVWFHHSVFYLTLFSLRHFSSRLQMMAEVSEFSSII